MRLELADFSVKEVRISGQTCFHNGVLEINKEEMVAIILEDRRIASAKLDLALPNEQTRIVDIRDVVEPRIKVSGPGCVFPGILGPVETVGEGRTHQLSGVTVIASAEYRPTILSGTAAQSSGMVDMWGPAAQMTPLSSTINIVLILKLGNGVTELEAHTAIQLAEFKIAHRLAEATRNLIPENLEVFELSKLNPSLPRVVYILGCVTTEDAPHPGVAYYGFPIRESLAIFVHPNEFLDGALTTDARRGSGTQTQTWEWMNQPVVLELLREHGKRLNFLGVILQRTLWQNEFDKQVSAVCTSQMARLLEADAAVITRTVTAGLSFIDTMLTVQACERKGVKTVLITPEWGGKDGTELPLVCYVPEATAMVSTGSFERDIKVPAPAKVIGGVDSQLVQLYAGDKPFSPRTELTLPSVFYFTGAVDWFGGMHLASRDY